MLQEHKRILVNMPKHSISIDTRIHRRFKRFIYLSATTWCIHRNRHGIIINEHIKRRENTKALKMDFAFEMFK